MFRRVVACIVVMGGLAASLVGTTAQADESPSGPSPILGHQIHGVVSSRSSDTAFVVTTAQHGDVNVTVPSPSSASTSRRGPRRGNGRANGRGRSQVVTQVAVGDRVVVHGSVTSASGATPPTFEARRIHVLPRAGVEHVVGTFKSFSGGNLTLTVGGTDKTFTVNSDTVVRPKGTSLGSITGTPTVRVVTRDGTLASSVNVHR